MRPSSRKASCYLPRNEYMNSKQNNKARLSLKADKLVHRYAFGSGLFGYIPVPVLDAFGIMAVQRKMLFHLAKVYNVPYSRSMAKDLIKTLAGGMASKAAIPMVAKMVPGVNILLGSTSMAAIGSASTFAVGKVFQDHFEKGGTLEDFDPKQEKALFEEELKKGIKISQDKEKKAKVRD